MTIKSFDDDGNEIETYTVEELEAQKAAAAEEAKQAATEELEKAKADLAEATEKLTKLSDKDYNFSEVNRQKKEAERKVEEVTKSFEEKLSATKKEILDGVQQEHYGSVLSGLAGGDDELKKKIEFHYNRLADMAATKEEVTKKLTDAYTLATRKEDDGALNTAVVSSGGAARITPQAGGQKLSAEEESVLQKMAQAGGMTLEKGKDY